MTSINETKLLHQSEYIYNTTNVLLVLYVLNRTIIKRNAIRRWGIGVGLERGGGCRSCKGIDINFSSKPFLSQTYLQTEIF